MNFTVHELPRAKADKRHILLWLLERSPQGGKAWLTAYDDALVTLADNADSFGEALESKDCPLPRHQTDLLQNTSWSCLIAYSTSSRVPRSTFCVSEVPGRRPSIRRSCSRRSPGQRW